MDELYLCINTNLKPYDLVESVWNEVFENWFSIASVVTNKGEFIIGDLGDDTKLDGRGVLSIPGEDQSSSPSILKSPLDLHESLKSIQGRLDQVEFENKEDNYLNISCVGSAPSGFRTFIDRQWRPRISPSFYFTDEKSSFEISLFDASWANNNNDLHGMIENLENLLHFCDQRILTRVEFEVDGKFLIDEDSWRSEFACLPLVNQSVR